MSEKINELYAWISTEPDGGEGVCAGVFGSVAVPLIGADKVRIESLRPYAEAIRKTTGYPVRLVKFTGREEGEPLP